ncbi:HAUS augmin-like complex subunit 1 [Cyrtonyx montezumae]|uniref:HAUS augmin-like complex subunit 1 n=1 Tax=Cyrtonyx montezumae TaxID=9017 RepID=UPI0032D9B453
MGQRTFGADGALRSDKDALLLIRDMGQRAHMYKEEAPHPPRSLLSALSFRDRGATAEERRGTEERRRLRHYGHRLAALQRLEAALSAAVQRPDPGPIGRSCGPTERLKAKVHDLGARIRSAQDAMRELRMEEGWTHAALVGQAEELARKERDIEAVRKELEAFLDLPPNIALARVKVAEAQQELDSLEVELAQRIEDLSRCGSPAP